ncbi:ATP-binding protein [Myxococcota bacterium]|nr:ATP-binding protein [Myxococcota bacterium]
MALTRHAPTILLSGLGLLATVGSVRLANRYEYGRDRARHQVAFADAASSVMLALEREVTAQLGVVEAMSAFFRGSERVEAEEFRTFAAVFLERFPGLEAVLWLEPTPEEAGAPTRYGVRFAEPAGAGLAALDFGSRATWRAAAEEAQRTGSSVSVEGLEAAERPLSRVVVRRAREKEVPGQGAREEVAVARAGLVVASTHLDDVAALVLDERLPGVQAVGGVDLYLFTDWSQGPVAPLHVHQVDQHPSSPAPALTAAGAQEGVHAVHRIPIGGASVLAVVRPAAPLAAPGWSTLGVFVLLAGVALTGASAVAVATLVSRTDSVTRLVDARTAMLRSATWELEARERHLRAIVENTVDGILTIDDQGRICTANPAVERMFGFPVEDLVGQPVSVLMPEPHRGRHEGYVQRYRADRASRVVGGLNEVEGQRADGTRFPLELSVSALGLGDGPAFLGVLRDISERKAVERMKDEFVSTVSHELRTPLTSMLGSLELLRDGLLGPLSETASRMVDVAYDSGERLVRLINDILDMERISTGGLRLRMEVLDGTELLEAAAQANRGFADLHGVLLARELATGPALVLGDRDRLLQVLTNLIGNAVKFSPPGGRVLLSMVRTDGHIVVHVTDQGPGIPEDFRARVFQPFSQADATDRRGSGGTGLGLSIAKAIVEAHGGSIWFESAAPRGTTFSFRLLSAEGPVTAGAPT